MGMLLIVLILFIFLCVAAVGGASGSSVGGLVVGAGCLLLFGGLIVPLFLTVFRNAAWLEGTTLVVRKPFVTRRCDLATAQLWADSVPEYTSAGNGVTTATGRRIPRLRAQDSATGKPAEIQLHDPATRNLLAPQGLLALANAISAGRRPEPDEWRAQQIANALRAMAHDPIANWR